MAGIDSRQREASDTLLSRAATEGLRVGPVDAPVVVMVFSDYSCGHCVEFSRALSKVRERYPGEVAVVMKHFDVGSDGASSAIHEAAECANEQHHFAAFNDAWFRLGPRIVTHEPWLDVAGRIGLASPGFAFCVRSHHYANHILRDTDEGMYLGVRGTPTSFINDVKVVGAVSFDVLNRLIAQELGRAARDPVQVAR